MPVKGRNRVVVDYLHFLSAVGVVFSAVAGETPALMAPN